MRTPPAMPPMTPAIDAAAASAIIDAALAAGRTMLSEVEGQGAAAAYGIPVVPTLIAADPGGASWRARRALARRHARRASLKILSDDITPQVRCRRRAARSRPRRRRSRRRPRTCSSAFAQAQARCRIAGFTLSPMIRRPHAHELIVGMSVDATFGPLMMFGAGGTAVEVVARHGAGAAAARPQAGARSDRANADRPAARRLSRPQAGRHRRHRRTLVRLSALICRHPEIREIDINPLLADEQRRHRARCPRA